ncbi:MAG: cell division protein ZapB [Desulfobacteraceae bacterium]|nr:MAG: cell division protein ZapB [Desulfobacteraceae bacterium]
MPKLILTATRGGNLDQDTVLQQFEFLENKIERLIEALKRHESENAELKQLNEQLAAQLQEKEAGEKRNDALKALVKSRIDSLMGRLSEFTEE